MQALQVKTYHFNKDLSLKAVDNSIIIYDTKYVVAWPIISIATKKDPPKLYTIDCLRNETPIQITGGDRFIAILTNHGNVYSNVITGEAPKNIHFAKPVTSIQCGYYYFVAVRTDGRIFGVGKNTFNTFTNGTTPNIEFPVCINESFNTRINVRKIRCSSHGTYILTTNKVLTFIGTRCTPVSAKDYTTIEYNIDDFDVCSIGYYYKKNGLWYSRLAAQMLDTINHLITGTTLYPREEHIFVAYYKMYSEKTFDADLVKGLDNIPGAFTQKVNVVYGYLWSVTFIVFPVTKNMLQYSKKLYSLVNDSNELSDIIIIQP